MSIWKIVTLSTDVLTTPFSKMAAENSNKAKLKTYTSTGKNTFALVTLQSFSISGVISAKEMYVENWKMYRLLYDWGYALRPQSFVWLGVCITLPVICMIGGMHYAPSHLYDWGYAFRSQSFVWLGVCISLPVICMTGGMHYANDWGYALRSQSFVWLGVCITPPVICMTGDMHHAPSHLYYWGYALRSQSFVWLGVCITLPVICMTGGMHYAPSHLYDWGYALRSQSFVWLGVCITLPVSCMTGGMHYAPASLHRLQALQLLVDARLRWSRWLTNSRACNASRKTRDIYLSSIEFEHRWAAFSLVWCSSLNYSLCGSLVKSTSRFVCCSCHYFIDSRASNKLFVWFS